MGGRSKKSTVGYQYFLGMHLALCHGPVSRLNQIIVGERTAWSGALEYTGTSQVSIGINAPDLFGGKKKEGGVEGTVDVCFGASDQTVNSYLSTRMYSGTKTPAFRGITCLVLNQCYVAAGSPYPKPWWVSLTRFPEESWYPAKADVNNGSANAAHIVRETILNEDWGMGYPVEVIDNDSFMEVADTLHDVENFGLSYILSGQGSIDEFLQEVIKTINGVLYTDRETGKFVLKLIRDDYGDPELLTSFGPDNILEYTSFQRAQPAEMINEVSIIYRRREDYSDASSTFQDLASVVTQGTIISQTMQFPGIDTDEIASLVGMRELKQHSTPLAQVVFTANRDAWNLNPGEAFSFTWPERGIERIVMRAIKLDYGSLQDGRIEVTAIEDVFGLPDASYISPQDPIWTDPVGVPTALDPNDVEVIEVPHYLLAVNLDPGDYSALLEDSSFIIFMAQYPAITGPSFQLWTSLLPGDSNYVQRITGTYAYHVSLAQNITESDNSVYIEVSDLPPNFSNDFEPEVEMGSLCLIKSEYDTTEELAIITGFDNVSDPNTIRLSRGALDTIPRSFNTSLGGTTIYFFENNWALDPTEYSEGSQVFCKPLPQTGAGTLAIGDATESIENMTGRQYLPSPPSYIRLGTTSVISFYPISVITTSAPNLYFTWNRTNRLTQTVDGVPPWFYSPLDVVPEDETKWWLYLYNEDNVDTTTPDSALSYDKLEKLDGSIKVYQWFDEQEIIEKPGPPPADYDVYIPLTINGEITGDGKDYTPAINQTNVVYHGDETEFNNGYMDIGDDLTGTTFTIAYSVKPDSDAPLYAHLSKSQFPAVSGDIMFLIAQWTNGDLLVQFGTGFGATRATYSGAVTENVYQTFFVNVTMNSPSSGNHIIEVWKDGISLGTKNIVTTHVDLVGSDWSIGSYRTVGEARTGLYNGFMKEVYFYNEIVTPDTTAVLRKNNKVRMRLKAVRTEGVDPDEIEIDSRDTFDWTFDRRGWTYNFDDYWNGDEA